MSCSPLEPLTSTSTSTSTSTFTPTPTLPHSHSATGTSRLSLHTPSSPRLLNRDISEGAAREDESALAALWQSTRPAAHSLCSPTSFSAPAASSSSSSSSFSSSSTTRCQRALESGHVFIRHSLSGRSVVSERVVVFVVRGVLYACKHNRHQSRYKQPFLSLHLSAASSLLPLTVYMGKQTAALRIVPAESAPERRCFALSIADQLLELEAPGSGDVRYWLRSLYELLTRTHSLLISHSLVFLPPHSVSAESVERAERRVRQLRMDGQRARRREEAERRLNGQQRTASEKALEERWRQEEVEQRRQRWMAAQQETEGRVLSSPIPAASSASTASTAASSSVVSPSRVRSEACARLDGDRRMVEAFERECEVEVERRRQLAAQPPQHVPALASEYAKHNQRCTALQIHTRAPLLAVRTHQVSGDEESVEGGAMRRLGESKSFPNLVTALSAASSRSTTPSASNSSCSSVAAPPPACATRSLSSRALRSTSPSQRRLPCHMPHSLSQKTDSQPASTPDTPRHAPTALAPTAQLEFAASHSTQPLCSPPVSTSSSSSSSFSAPSLSLLTATPAFSLSAPSSSCTATSTPRTSTPPLPNPRPHITPTSSAQPYNVRSSSTFSSDPSSPSTRGSALSLFEPASPFYAPLYHNSSSLYSPVHSLPVTAVYSVRTASAAPTRTSTSTATSTSQPQQLDALCAAWSPLPGPFVLSGGSAHVKSAAAMPDPLHLTRPTAATSPHSVPPPAVHSSSICFHCAIELPDLSTVAAPSAAAAATTSHCPPLGRSPHFSSNPSTGHTGGGTHFHFHLHTAHSPSSTSRPPITVTSINHTATHTGRNRPMTPPPPPYTAA